MKALKIAARINRINCACLSVSWFFAGLALVLAFIT